ncbi:hypothetical protein COT60_03585 [Candidatus Pacearchaeota archaeon CG09_land_8_20_14_0_10_30_9]|nr:AAA family ATPase [Candidatus Pacearchaeota archaeon]OIO40280.1 MAG: hypothetical protein AUJ61_02255 [Candidatus Pacearchaeota archaeon CG1_02_30_18]PIN71072.1 MAG: hypothetical protein COV77_03975 [Candidatus Pacearchaeota archaeon CG11_big_fil_rev_8_21_14_0_20_30_13]PIO00841.1 MAG: hypothetical protein COT60_03585 [Candidatus Pacearchaeota archaeon CG09_land_8_20_14_0_10_30_9]PIZ82142.1 MAG: hypothetical protein COX98_00990 [Candidatus Pacearchaeota archaeon CG_4_10_14_0_2_um_filter_30_11
MIVGITGTLGAGKGTIVEYLKTKDFTHYSVRSFIVEEIKKRGLPINRDTMVLIGNKLREANYPSYIIEEIYKKAKLENSNTVIESLRTIGEVEALREKKDFYLFSVDADIEKRYDRILKRKIESDFVSFEEFVSNEKREMENKDLFKQNLKRCIEMADFKFENNGTIEDLYKGVEKILIELDN